MIPLVALDLDGTLIGSSGQVDACVWKAVEKAQESGVRMAAVTGRPCMGTAQRVAARLGPNNPHIFQNGALIAYPDGEILKVTSLRETATRALVGHARELGYVLELYTPNSLFVERKTPVSEAHAKMIGVSAMVRDLLDVAASEPVIRAQWVVTADQLREVRSLSLPDVELGEATSPAQKDITFLSVTRTGTSKGSALVQLCSHLKLDVTQVMAVGDSAGDRPMLDVAGHPVVMGNAGARLRASYPHVVGTVDDCGVREALELASSDRLA